MVLPPPLLPSTAAFSLRRPRCGFQGHSVVLYGVCSLIYHHGDRRTCSCFVYQLGPIYQLKDLAFWSPGRAIVTAQSLDTPSAKHEIPLQPNMNQRILLLRCFVCGYTSPDESARHVRSNRTVVDQFFPSTHLHVLLTILSLLVEIYTFLHQTIVVQLQALSLQATTVWHHHYYSQHHHARLILLSSVVCSLMNRHELTRLFNRHCDVFGLEEFNVSRSRTVRGGSCA